MYIHDGGYGRSYSSPGDGPRDIGDLQGALQAFRESYEHEGSAFEDFYDYACALSIDGQVDSAFKYLWLATELDTAASMLGEPDFLNLRKDRRWRDFEDKLISNLQRKYGLTYKDTAYAKRLWHIHAKDQAHYDCIFLAREKIGNRSTIDRAVWQLKERLNQENQEELEQLIEAKGWPKISEVGEKAALSALLVVQHADLAMQQKYLPILEERCKAGEADPEGYALLYDRVQMGLNKPQKYGSQLKFNEQTGAYEVYQLLDETMVDQWRAEMGLGPLADYVGMWGIEFTPGKK
mgnify:CR=1 FL=1